MSSKNSSTTISWPGSGMTPITGTVRCDARSARYSRRRAVGDVDERGDALDDVRRLLRGQLGLNRQRHGFQRGTLAFRERARRVTEIREALLQVHRNGVIDFGSDAAALQVCLQRIAVRDADDVLV